MTTGSRRPRHLFDGPGETRAAMRAKDWAATPLGPVETWPDELCAAIRTVLPSEIPMLLWWGPQLIQIFNDAYTPLLGVKYPRAIGQPGAECWSEVWAELGPLAEAVLRGDGATYAENQLLLLRRHGYLEETYWTFSYSPVHRSDGTVAGVFVATTDVTERVLGDRRMETLRSLGELSAAAAETAADACRAAIDVLADRPADVPLALAYLRDGPGTDGALTLVAATGVKADSELAHPALAEIGELVEHGEPVEVADLAARFPGARSSLGDTPVERALVLPLQAFGRSNPIGALVLGISPYRELDGPYRTFAELVANQVSTALTDALAYTEERTRAAVLAELAAAKTRFFQNVSHEFRTPLTLLLGPLRTVLDAGLLPEPHRAAMRAAHTAALRLRRLVDTLLDVARSEADQLRARPDPTDVATLTAECASMFRSAAESAGVALEVRVGPARAVLLDREMWAKIVLNLVSNAVKNTRAGAITVGLQSVGGRLVLTVADTGIGIPEGEQERIFDRFHQVTGSQGRSGEGTGIGLSLVRDLVGALGGTVSVTSAPGVGSTFTVSVPEVRVAGDGVGLTEAAARLGEAFRGEAEGWRPAGEPVAEAGGVLLVEDNADMRDYLSRLLVEQGWPVHAVGDADAALTHAVVYRPDLVLSDVMLPGRDGLDLLREIRAHESLRRVPVVLLTARAGPESAVEGLREGADDYVVKPFHPDELLSRVRAHLELSQLREAVIAANDREVTTLRGALDSRSTVSQAVGLLMATHRCDAETAFSQLVAVSQATNRKVRDIAATVVADFTDNLAPQAD